MKHLLVGITILLIVALALYYGVITIHFELLHRNLGPILQSVTEILAGAAVGTCMNDPPKSTP